MKIIYIANVRMPTEKAHGLQIMKMCEAFKVNGVELELVVPKRSNKIKSDPFEYYDIKNKFKITYIPCLDFISAFPILGKFWFLLQLFTFIIGARLYLIFNKADLIFTRSPIITALFKNATVEVHHLSKNNKKLEAWLLRRAKKNVVLTSYLKKTLMDYGVKAENVLVSPDAVDLDIFDLDLSKEQARELLNLPNNKKILVYTGKFTTMGEDKGLSLDFKAVSLMPAQDILLIAVGGSPWEVEKYNILAQNLGISDKIMLLGGCNQKTLAIYQKAADILLMTFPNTEHYAYYMSPLKMFEYMASKRPIIASDLPSIRDVLQGDDCLFISPGSTQDLLNKINFVLNNPLNVRDIAELAYRRISNFTWTKRADNIQRFISN